MSDAFFGRIFQVLGRIPPFGTVSMTTYFHASADELRRMATPRSPAWPMRRSSIAASATSRSSSTARGGQLLATGVQVAYFRA